MTRSKPIIPTPPLPPFAARAARLSIASGVLFALLLGGLHLVEPEFDPTWRFISEYALGDYGWMMSLAFATLALSLAGTGAAIFTQVRSVLGYIGLFVLGVGTIGILIAAIFETDPVTATAAGATTSGKMHVLGASLDYTPVAALLLSFSLVRHATWRRVRAALFITAAITVLATVAFLATLPSDFVFGPGVYTGLVGRFLVLSYLGWILTVGLHTLRLRKEQASISESARVAQPG